MAKHKIWVFSQQQLLPLILNQSWLALKNNMVLPIRIKTIVLTGKDDAYQCNVSTSWQCLQKCITATQFN